MIKCFGKQIAESIISWLLARVGSYLIMNSFCSIFPLRPILEAPDFNAAVKKAGEDYLKRCPGFESSDPDFERWLRENGSPVR